MIPAQMPVNGGRNSIEEFSEGYGHLFTSVKQPME
jgi:hypothetical protein